MNSPNLMDTASRIKLERQKRSWSQEQLAERAKLSTRTVQRLESGAEAAPETLRLIADALGLPPETLQPQSTRVHFSAPWSKGVKVITALVIVLVLALSTVIPLITRAPHGHVPSLIGIAALILTLAYGVHGFSIKGGQLLVHRLGWATRFDLSRLSAFEVNPRALMGSIRLFGNGGVFCYTGLYRNGVLGKYRAYVTDPTRSVVLEFGGRKIVVSPDDPEAFVEAIREAAKGVCSGREVKASVS